MSFLFIKFHFDLYVKNYIEINRYLMVRPKWHYSWFFPTSPLPMTPATVTIHATTYLSSIFDFHLLAIHRYFGHSFSALAASLTNRKRPRIEISWLHQHPISELQPRSVVSAFGALSDSSRTRKYSAAIVGRRKVQNDEVHFGGTFLLWVNCNSIISIGDILQQSSPSATPFFSSFSDWLPSSAALFQINIQLLK